MKKNIAIVCGGDSSEWVVSMRSAQGIYSFMPQGVYNLYIVSIRQKVWEVVLSESEKSAIDKNDFSFNLAGDKIYFDFAYITIHGTPGENGLLQGYFDMIGLKYSCCGVLTAALTFNKSFCNKYLKSFGAVIAESLVLRPGDAVDEDAIIDRIGLPCFIKPNVGGSSFGTTKVKQPEQIRPAIQAALDEGGEVIIEAFIEGTEITCGCYKTKTKNVVLPITEVVTENEFFDYEAKYTASKAQEITPARISSELTQQVQDMTSRFYDILSAKGIIRIDYIIKENVPYLLEVNTTPGMTSTSFIPQQVRAAGISISEVMQDIIENEIGL